MFRIAHLVDDTSPGGVTRYLEFIARDPGLGALGRHDIIAVPRNRPLARRIEADLIVSHLAVSWRGLPGMMALRARHAGVPMVHVEHSYAGGFVAARVVKRHRFLALLRCTYALFDRVVAVSEAQGGWLRLRGLVPEPALAVIPPCVDLAPFRALAAPRGPVRTIGAIGRFDPQKGFDLLIAAFRALPRADLRLRLIGDGAERARLAALAGDDPRITFTGFTADTATALAACDAVAMPSRWEPFGLVALEAAAAGRPVLVSGVDGLADHAARGAIAVRGRSVESWTEALAALAEAAAGPAQPADAMPEQRTQAGWAALIGGLNPRGI